MDISSKGERLFLPVYTLARQMVVKPSLQFRLCLPVTQKTLSIHLKEPLETFRGKELPHGVKIEHPRFIVPDQKIRRLAITVADIEFIQRFEQVNETFGHPLFAE
jgi:hypothetical protein